MVHVCSAVVFLIYFLNITDEGPGVFTNTGIHEAKRQIMAGGEQGFGGQGSMSTRVQAEGTLALEKHTTLPKLRHI